ncbi:MAG: TolC family protein [Pseudomonadales bacterium]|nr:TolC family protein [Pseudomonadales bacterium]
MKDHYRHVACAAFPAYRFVACIGLLLFAGAVQSAETVGTALSLREAIEATLHANPQLGVYRFREQALMGMRSSASLQPPLQVNGTVEDALGTGRVKRFESSEFTLSLSRVIELGGQRDARVVVVGERRELLRTEQRITELDLLAEVTRRFIATAAAQEGLALQQRASALALQIVEALQPLVTAGQTPMSEQLRATAALTRTRLAEARAQTELEAAKISLASMWSSQSPGFARVTANLLDTGEQGDLNALLQDLEASPDMLLFASEQRLQDARVREVLSERQGTLQWTAGIRHLRESDDAALMFGVSRPLGSRTRAAGALATAQADQQEVASRRAVALNQMRAQLFALYLPLQQAVIEVATLRDEVLPQLDSAREQTRAAYLGGSSAYLNLSTAQAEYLDAEQALVEAATTAHLLRVEIERLSGTALNPDAQESRP